MAFKMSPIGKKKCPYSPMQKKGLINPSPATLSPKAKAEARQRAKRAGYDNFDEYFKATYPKKSAEKVASSGGSTVEVAGRSATAKEFISGMANYDKTEYINDRGEMIMRFQPKKNLIGSTVKYYEQSQRGEGPTKEISGDRLRCALARIL